MQNVEPEAHAGQLPEHATTSGRMQREADHAGRTLLRLFSVLIVGGLLIYDVLKLRARLHALREMQNETAANSDLIHFLLSWGGGLLSAGLAYLTWRLVRHPKPVRH